MPEGELREAPETGMARVARSRRQVGTTFLAIADALVLEAPTSTESTR